MRDEPLSFDRSSLTTAASLNEVVLLTGPYRGRSGADLLSRDAVAALAPDLDPLRLIDELLVRPDRLEAVGCEVGKRVAALVSTLRSGPRAEAPLDLPPARVRSLEEWRLIDDVILGGGLLVGAMGSVVLDEAQKHLDDEPRTHLSVSRHAPWLGLIGAARTCGEGEHLVVDGGQTSIKPAVAEVRGGVLRRLRLLPTVPFEASDDVAAVLDGVLAKYRRWVSQAVPCSVATYVRDGRPIVFRGNAYERLATAPTSVLERIRLFHDGSAAWLGTGRESSSAVIVMGTFLGVGMGPHLHGDGPLLPLSRDLEIGPDVEQL